MLPLGLGPGRLLRRHNDWSSRREPGVARDDERKRKEILNVAERLFAIKPFHEVRLDEVAARAKIGKGTIYIYFRSKEHLYASTVREGTLEMVQDLRERLAAAQQPALTQLELVVSALVDSAAARPNMYQLMRAIMPKICRSGTSGARDQKVDLIRDVIIHGINRGEFQDPNPQLTAQFILASVRGGTLFADGREAPEKLKRQIMDIFGAALVHRPCRRERKEK